MAASALDILMHGAEANRDSWDRWEGQQNQQDFERAMGALGGQRAMALQGVKQAGEEKLEGMRNTGALARVKAQVQGYIDRLDDKQKGKDMAKWKALGVVPKPGEEPDDFLARAAVEHGQRVAGQANTIWGEIQRREQQANTLMNGEQTRLAGLAVQRAKDQFAPSVDPKLQPLLKSQSVEQVLAKLPSKQQAPLKAQWEQILEAEQQKARTEFSPNVSSQIQMLKYGIDQMQKRHSDIVGSNPFASEFLKFDLPEAPKTFDEALAAASKGGAKPASGATSGTGTNGASPALPMQFLPSALQNPDVLSAVNKYHPMGAGFSADTGDILGNTRAAINKRLEDAHAALSGMHVSVGPNGEVVVPPSIKVVQSYAGWPDPNAAPNMDQPLSPAQRQAMYMKANSILSGMHEDASALQTVTPPAGGTPIDAGAGDVLGGGWDD